MRTPHVSLNQFDLAGAATVIGSLASLMFVLGATEQQCWLPARVLVSLTGFALLAGGAVLLAAAAAGASFAPFRRDRTARGTAP